MKTSACIDALYGEIPFLDRFQAAKDDGFDAVEFWGWPEKDLNAVKEAAEKAGIPICGFNGDADLSTPIRQKLTWSTLRSPARRLNSSALPV